MPELVLNFVYGLPDPRLSGVSAVRHIGVTVKPNERYQMHLSCPVSEPVEKNAWVWDVLTAGFEPGVEIFEVFVTQDIRSEQAKAKRKERETRWIRHYMGLGADLLNIQENGASDRQNDTELSSSRFQVTNPILNAGRVLDDGTIIREIDFDDFFDLFMVRGAIGTGD
jgi:hypothetical protein